MHKEVLEHLIGRRPFKPLQVVVASGEAFPVPHPELAILGEHILAVLNRPQGDATDPQMVWIDYEHIVYCQPLPTREAPF